MKINRHDITSHQVPNRATIIAYLERNGYPHPEETDDKWMIDSFTMPENYERRFQYWEAVKEDIALFDFDRWQHFQNVIGYELPYKDFQKINAIFDDNDIEILEMHSPKETVW